MGAQHSGLDRAIAHALKFKVMSYSIDLSFNYTFNS